MYPPSQVVMGTWDFTKDLTRKPHPAPRSSLRFLPAWLSNAEALRPDERRLTELICSHLLSQSLFWHFGHED